MEAILHDLFLDDEADVDILTALLTAANAATVILLELEEGVVAPQNWVWVKIAVDINEYRRLPDPTFGLHFRMSRHIFEELVQAVGNHLVDKGRWRRTRTPLTDIMLMVLWIMATPDSFRSVALRFGVSPGTLYFHYAYIIEALREMASNYIQWPNEQERNEIKSAFQRANGFPGVVGCVDCTHVYITKPLQGAGAYVNRHHSYSLTVQAVADHTLLVRDLYVGEPGSLHDSRTFRKSSLSSALLEDHESRLLKLDEHLLGDGAYTLTHFMMIPYENNGHLTAEQKRFNHFLCQLRARIENAFGFAKNKWRRLKFLHAASQRNIVDHITASFVLHNFIVLHGEPLITEEDLAQPIPMPEDEPIAHNGDPEEEIGNEHPLLHDARRRGEEKRQFILTNVVPLLED